MKKQSSTQANSPTLPAKPIVPLDKDDSSSSPNNPQGARPLLSHLFGGGRSNSGRLSPKSNSTAKKTVRVRIGAEDELLKKNRRTVDHYLRRIGALMGKEVSLNEQGMAFFSFQKKFVIVAEVPADNNAMMYLYTMVCRVEPQNNQIAVLQRAMELNYMQHGLTAGATLGLDGEEVNYCLQCKISNLTFADLRATMESFLRTAVEINEQLDAVKERPRSQSFHYSG